MEISIIRQKLVTVDNLNIVGNTIFDVEQITKAIKQSKNIIAYSLIVNGIKVGFALIDTIKEHCQELMFFEVFPVYQGKGFGTIFAKYIIDNHSIHLRPVNGSVHFWMKLGAKPVLFCGLGCILCISHLRPSEYYKLLVGDDNFEEKDDFIYVKEEWCEYASMF